jgi:excisionase family DNA binding protein
MTKQAVADLRTHTPDTDPELWLTVVQASDLMRVSVSTVQRHAKRGELSTYRGPIGFSNEALTRYYRPDCDHYVLRHSDPDPFGE